MSRRYTWRDVAPAYLSESLDRGAFWCCARKPELAQLQPMELKEELSIEAFYQRPETPGSSPLEETREYQEFSARKEDNDRLGKTLESTAGVSLLLIFLSSHGPASFRQAACSSPDLTQLARYYDRFYGQPSARLKRVFREGVARFLALPDWPSYFQALALPCPPPRTLLAWLRGALERSESKGYHSSETVFSQVRGNVQSNILLRGKSYPKVCFLIDTSGSMDSQFSKRKKENLPLYADLDNPNNARDLHGPNAGHSGYFEAPTSDSESITRLAFVVEQLEQVLRFHLEKHQQVCVARFDHDAHLLTLPGQRGWLLCSENNINNIIREVKQWRANGGTSITAALTLAYSLDGLDAVYLLSDGEDRVNLAELKTMCSGKASQAPIPCHTTSLCASNSGQKLLEDIAKVTGGEYRQVSYAPEQ